MYRNTYDESGNLLNSTPGQGIYYVPAFPGATSYNWTVPSGATIASGQGTNSIVVNFNLATFVNGDISVNVSTACGVSPSSSITVVRLGGVISGPSQICSLTSASYSIPVTIGSGFTWSVPTWMTITSGQGTNAITVDITSFSNCKNAVVNVNFTSNCSTSETVALNVGCAEYTKLIASQCNATLPSINVFTQAENVSLLAPSMYKFRINDGTTDYFVESVNGKFGMISVPGLSWQFGASYTVDVALKIDGVYKAYGCACTVTMPSLPTTQIQASQCNTTLASEVTNIYADWIDGATSYKFRISDGVTTQYLIRPTRIFRINNVVWAWNKTYTIDVAIKRGTSDYGAYGPACTISTPASTARQIESTLNTTWEVTFDQNPFENYFKLNLFSESLDTVNVTLFDLTGKQLEKVTTSVDGLVNYQFGLNIASGIYLVTINQGSNSQTLRMIKR